jgi:hypothetical protein
MHSLACAHLIPPTSQTARYKEALGLLVPTLAPIIPIYAKRQSLPNVHTPPFSFARWWWWSSSWQRWQSMVLCC